jgi:crotonobetainyl-CoA:carnitine CoA-transferase CaiB-like acyl-CoA transferase
LADLGATIVKVERPGGDFARHYDTHVNGLSSHFVWANRGKQSVVLDLMDAADRATFDALLAGADVFIHNVAPASARRLGIDADALTAQYEGLVACEISGYGAGGPRSDDKAYDLAIQAEAGVFAVTGGAEMSRVGFAAADIAAGMYALSGILAALLRREATGQGAVVRVSMLDSLVEWMSAPLYADHFGPVRQPRTGRRHPGIAPYGTFSTRGGRTILIAVQNDREWRALAELVLDDATLAADARFDTNPHRIAHVEEVEALVADRLAELDDDEALRLLSSAGVATASVNDLGQVWAHPQLLARGRFESVATEEGDVELLASPFDISDGGTSAQIVPALGEHDPTIVHEIIERGRRRPPNAGR